MTLKLNGSTDGSVSIDAPADTSPTGSDITLTLPTTVGSANQFVKNGSTAGSLEYSSMVEDSTGVGIGTSAPSELLHTVKGSGTSRVRFEASASHSFARIVAGSTSYNSGVEFFSGSTNTANITAQGSGELVVEANGDERMRIDSSGRLLVGTSSSIGASSDRREAIQAIEDSGARICLGRDSTSLSAGFSLGGTEFYSKGGDGSFDLAGAILCRGDGTHAAGDKPTRLEFQTTASGSSSPTERMRISNNGFVDIPGVYDFTTASAANVNVDSTGGIRRSTSSSKYKTNIETLNDSFSDALLACRPVWYRSTCEGDNPDHSWWGFIAEEVAEIDPRLVHWKTTEVTYNENGSVVESPCDPEPEGVAYDRFVPHLLNLIKRQKATITAQQAQIDDLLSRVTALEAA
jgi:hypothetical protein